MSGPGPGVPGPGSPGSNAAGPGPAPDLAVGGIGTHEASIGAAAAECVPLAWRDEARRRLADDARSLLDRWSPPTDAQGAQRALFVEFLDLDGPAAVDRDSRAGHLTASTLLVDHSRERVLLTLHPLVGGWVQLGGHLEPGDASILAAAAREVAEESGIADARFRPEPIGLDRHQVSCRDGRRRRGPSVHYDITFLAVAPRDAAFRISDESLDLAWFPVGAPPGGADDVVRGLLDRARSLGHL